MSHTRFLRRSLSLLVSMLLMVGVLIAVAGPAAATTVEVGTEAEYRQALADLSVDDSGPHTIVLSSNITIAGSADPTYTGTQPLTIVGRGFTLDGDGNSRVLYVNNGGDITLVNVTITGGYKSGPGGGMYLLNAHIRIVNSVVTGNRTNWGDGGGIGTTNGDITVVNSVVSENVGEDGGGLIGRYVKVVNSTVSGNVGTFDKGEGGGIFGEQVTVVNSTITDNSSNRDGGGIISRGPLVLRKTEVSNNSAPRGANISVISGGGMTAMNSTVTSPSGSTNCYIEGGSVARRSFDDDGSCGFG